MMVEIFLVVDEKAEGWRTDRVQGRVPMLSLEAESSDENEVCQFLKGAALSAISYYSEIPNKIEFRVSRKAKA